MRVLDDAVRFLAEYVIISRRVLCGVIVEHIAASRDLGSDS